MATPHQQTLRVFETLRPGDLVQLSHEVKVGFRTWQTTTVGRVVHAQRRRQGLHHQRNFDDKAFSDVIVLQRDDGEFTTVTLDDFSELRKLESAEMTERQINWRWNMCSPSRCSHIRAR